MHTFIFGIKIIEIKYLSINKKQKQLKVIA
jgi:hypothetical protein